MLKITGYSDRISARPGETVRFMVNCEHPTYRTDVVRLICGDDNPKGPGYKETVVPTPINGKRHRGRRQAILMGSYGIVPSKPVLDSLDSFTVAAYVWPTTPKKGEQALIGRWQARGGAGFTLVIDDRGALALRVGDGKGRVETVSTGRKLRERYWYLVAASVDAATRKVTLHQEPLSPCIGVKDQRTLSRRLDLKPAAAKDAPLLFAAHAEGKTKERLRTALHYNGRIDSPRLARGALSRDEIDTLLRSPHDARVIDALVAAWDFSIDIPTTRLADSGPERLDGETVNLPARAMTGHNWTGEELNWQRAPHHYGAVHFHDDDLYDAGWEVDFPLEIPASLKSGIYAARLRAGKDEEYIPFVVLPRRGKENKVAFLMPSASYMAYANESLGYGMSGAEMMAGQLTTFSPTHLFLLTHPEYGQSLYDSHSDGSGVCYSSRLRPILNMRPKYQFQFSCRSEAGSRLREFNADLNVIDWLTHFDIPHDVITDEDLHDEGYPLLKPYRAVITGGHPEYYSAAMRDAVARFTQGGGRFMYLGGNGFYWRVAFSETLPGVIELRRAEGGIRTWEARVGEAYMGFTGEYGGMWRRQGNTAPQALVGVGFTSEGFDNSSYYRRTKDSFDPRVAFMFKGIGKDELIGDFGYHGDGAAGNELDRADPALGTPSNALVVASSENHSESYLLVNEEILVSNPWVDGTNNPLVRADIVFYETPNGGAVFSTGSIAYNGALPWNNYDNNVARLTTNVLRRFMDPKPFL
ncbi:MAG: N,N-dimethylformamidase beta subunit family domain-containing protein [Alphaproteobacteria bacterium]